jgi:hypothetical protein
MKQENKMRLTIKTLCVLSILYASSICAEDIVTTPAITYPYKAMIVVRGDNWNVIRFQPQTGKAWRVQDGVFMEIKDAQPLPLGEYEFSSTTTFEFLMKMPPIQYYWKLVRMNALTGETWWDHDDQWEKIKEPQESK